MRQAPPRLAGEIAHASFGWSVSLVVHGAAFAAGMWLVSTLHMPQEPERFRWEISLVSPSASTDPAAARPFDSSTRREASSPAPPQSRTSGQIHEPARTVGLETREVEPPAATPLRPIQSMPASTDRGEVQNRPSPVVEPVIAPPQRQMVAGETNTRVQADSESSISRNVVPTVHESVRDSRPAVAPRAEPALAQTPASALETVTETSAPSVAKTEPVVQKAASVATSMTPGAPSIHALDTAGSSSKEADRPHVSGTPEAPPLPSPLPQASLASLPSPGAAPVRPDYGWLNGMLIGRVRERQEYPTLARLHGVEGRVQVRIVIRQNGELGEVSIVRSSGSPVLDEAALKTVRDAFPLPFNKPLDAPQLVRVIPISYTLD